MDQIRIAADSSCDLLTMDGVDFVSVPLTVRTAVEEFRDDAALNVDAMVTTLLIYYNIYFLNSRKQMSSIHL